MTDATDRTEVTGDRDASRWSRAEAFLRARGTAEMPHPGKGVGVVKNIKSPMHLSDTPLDGYKAPPKLGEHTREVLTGLLGYSAGEVEALAKDETI